MLYHSMIGRFWFGKFTPSRTGLVVLTAQPARLR
jgi:hypothetical protein